jgi:prepilin-type N-terminal cleavage/methylation domain-containing protein
MQNAERRMQNGGIQFSSLHSSFCISSPCLRVSVVKRYVPRRAFTLVEIMLAVLLMGLLASAAALSFSKPLQAARAQDAAEQIRFFDESCRLAARRFGREVWIVFDLSGGTLSRKEGGRETYRSQLPHGCRISAIRTSEHRASDGELEIPCSPLGITHTYAVRIDSPASKQWLLVSGLGGTVTRINDDTKLDSIFSTIAPRQERDGSNEPAGDDAD